jgi:DNA-binding winged helix-turn-helix (wHTH) protein
MPNIAGLTGPSLYDFGAIKLRGDGTLALDGRTIHLPPKELHVLRLLLDGAGAVISKHKLLDAVWPRCDIGEESLTRCIYSLRKMFGQYKRYIATVYGVGYRLTCNVYKDGAGDRVRDRLIRVVPPASKRVAGELKKSRAHRIVILNGAETDETQWRIRCFPSGLALGSLAEPTVGPAGGRAVAANAIS